MQLSPTGDGRGTLEVSCGGSTSSQSLELQSGVFEQKSSGSLQIDF